MYIQIRSININLATCGQIKVTQEEVVFKEKTGDTRVFNVESFQPTNGYESGHVAFAAMRAAVIDYLQKNSIDWSFKDPVVNKEEDVK